MPAARPQCLFSLHLKFVRTSKTQLSNFKFDTWNCGTTHKEHSTDHKELEPRLRRLIENYKSISQRMRMTSLWPLGLEVIANVLHLWLSLIALWLFCLLHLWAKFITFMVSGFITFVDKSYYIYGQFLLHLWSLLHLWVIQWWIWWQRCLRYGVCYYSKGQEEGEKETSYAETSVKSPSVLERWGGSSGQDPLWKSITTPCKARLVMRPPYWGHLLC